MCISGKRTVCNDVRQCSAVSTVVGRGKRDGSGALQADEGHAEDGMPDASFSAESKIYLATGNSFQDLALQFYRSESTVGQIVRSTCEALWTHLQPIYMPIPDEGSRNINYKGFLSIVLMAVADANGMFTLIDVGDLGRNSDGVVSRHLSHGKLLKQGKLNVPNATCLLQDTNHEPFPYYFIGDEAFLLLPYLMRPGRKSVECAFGMLTSKFRVFDDPIACNEDCAVAIVKAQCLLHDFIRFVEEKFQETSNFAETNGAVLAMPDGSRLEETLTQSQAVRMWNRLGNYFSRQEGAIAIQWKYHRPLP
ncbi:hypothetical protein PR048_025035 [Dryococelus australis]|uniref:DDE Tnp4 domain-containing protein n=1 Tax=Dryococelus australis TaxID=614101 RepID=A0ABQ9GQC2_9NEOP|nr:hypothetical protein PR048_025035 [Dryococelus australis]